MLNTEQTGAKMNASRIVQILEVRDTREYMEDGDRWVAIPGSGAVRECDRCGRRHEVHATVVLEDGTTAVVGTGCMATESMEVQAALKAGAAQAKTARVNEYREASVDAAAWRLVGIVRAAWGELADGYRAKACSTSTTAFEVYGNRLLCWGERRLAWALEPKLASKRLERLESVIVKATEAAQKYNYPAAQ